MTQLYWGAHPEYDAAIAAGVRQGLSWQDIADHLTLTYKVRFTDQSVRGRTRRPSFGVVLEHPPEPDPVVRFEAKAHVERDRVADRQLVREIAKSQAERDLAQATLDLYEQAHKHPIIIPDWQQDIRASQGQHHAIVMAQLTDWHLDEVVEPDEVEYLNAYNADIAMIRMKRWVEKVATLPREYVKGITIDGLVIPATGDLFTGEIHAELKESNERRILESLLFWQAPVMAALRTLEREYPAVAVHAVVGNHGRLAQKSVFKGRVYDNVEWLFWSTIRDRLADLGSTITVNVATSMDLNVPVYGRNYLLTHGDQFKGGTGISGAFAPLSLGSHRKGKRQSMAGLPMETMVIGHLHQLINIPGVIMGGTMKGIDEFAFGINVPPAEASQALWITTPERAQTIWMPVYLQSRTDEGW